MQIMYRTNLLKRSSVSFIILRYVAAVIHLRPTQLETRVRIQRISERNNKVKQLTTTGITIDYSMLHTQRRVIQASSNACVHSFEKLLCPATTDKEDTLTQSRNTRPSLKTVAVYT